LSTAPITCAGSWSKAASFASAMRMSVAARRSTSATFVVAGPSA
jgi:hypothetical protein